MTVISKALADKLFPNVDAGEAVGQRLTVDAEDEAAHTLTIIGVTGDFPTPQMSTNREQLLLPLGPASVDERVSGRAKCAWGISR